MARLIRAQMQKPIRGRKLWSAAGGGSAGSEDGGSSACQRRKAKLASDGTGEWRWLDGRDVR